MQEFSIEDVEELLKSCTVCPRKCGTNRYEGKGYCGGTDKARVSLVSLHKWEEPIIAGERGAGTVFFSGCNLRCVYCQNYEISHSDEAGREVSLERLAEIFLEQQSRGATNLDLVTPTHFVPQILFSLFFAKKKGFCLPVVYNSSGYENIETLNLLNGYVDVFLPDLKYYNNEIAREYSNANNYFDVAKKAICRMVQLKGAPVVEGDRMLSGVLVRHLVLPGGRKDSMKLLEWLWQEFGDRIYLSLMNQYTPMYRAKEYPNLRRRLTTFEYQSVVDYAYDLGFRKCFIQEKRADGAEFVPEWTEAGV